MISLHAFERVDRGLARSLVSLQQQSYAVEAVLIGVPEIPPMRETEQDLVDAREQWIVAQEDDDDVVAGVAWERLEDGTIDIVKLVVRPDRFRRGLGRQLLEALDAVWPVSRFIVSTGEANAPARALYEQRGFRVAGRRPIGHDAWVVDYVRDAPPG